MYTRYFAFAFCLTLFTFSISAQSASNKQTAGSRSRSVLVKKTAERPKPLDAVLFVILSQPSPAADVRTGAVSEWMGASKSCLLDEPARGGGGVRRSRELVAPGLAAWYRNRKAQGHPASDPGR